MRPSNLTPAGQICADIVIEWCGREPGGADFAAGIYLAAWLFGDVGRHAIRISKFTGLPRQFCVWCGLNMRHGGRWHEGVIDEWQSREDGTFIFNLDMMTASGTLRKHGHNFDQSRYKLGGSMPLRAPP